MFKCYHCLSESVCWDCDYDCVDFGYEMEGIVQVFHCMNCGAEIEYVIPFNRRDDEDVDFA